METKRVDVVGYNVVCIRRSDIVLAAVGSESPSSSRRDRDLIVVGDSVRRL